MNKKRKSGWWGIAAALALVGGGVILFTALSKTSVKLDPTKLARV